MPSLRWKCDLLPGLQNLALLPKKSDPIFDVGFLFGGHILLDLDLPKNLNPKWVLILLLIQICVPLQGDTYIAIPKSGYGLAICCQNS